MISGIDVCGKMSGAGLLRGPVLLCDPDEAACQHEDEHQARARDEADHVGSEANLLFARARARQCVRTAPPGAAAAPPMR